MPYAPASMDPGTGAPSFGDRLATWLADATADESVAKRRRERWLRTQADEEASLRGVLVDLAERDTPVVVTTRGGRTHRGRATVVGDDVLVMERDGVAVTLLALGSVASVRPAPGHGPVAGDRRGRSDVALAEVLRLLVGERPRVVVVAGAESVAGELARVGGDVLTVRLEGDGGRAYVALDAIDEVVVDDPGALGGRS